MPQVAATLTNWSSPAQFAKDVTAAFQRIGLPPMAAALFTAHSALSTGWGKAVHNWNLAGLKLCTGCENTYDWTLLTGTEVINNVETPKTPMKWRAFKSLDEGVAALWQNLQASRYDPARAMLLAGNPEYFAEVGRNGWYTASPTQMKAEMTSRLDFVLKTTGIAASSGSGLFRYAVLLVGGWWLWKRFGG